jgi:hypothetical protein
MIPIRRIKKAIGFDLRLLIEQGEALHELKEIFSASRIVFIRR